MKKARIIKYNNQYILTPVIGVVIGTNHETGGRIITIGFAWMKHQICIRLWEEKIE